MTHAIELPTPFEDVNELAQSFASRVDEERLMLPNAQAIPVGEWVRFAVTLGDGSAALSGLGRCSDCIDRGHEHAPEHRFDVVLDALELEEMAQVYFERILMARQAQAGGDPVTGQVDLDEEEISVEAPEFTESAHFDDGPTQTATADQLAAMGEASVELDDLGGWEEGDGSSPSAPPPVPAGARSSMPPAPPATMAAEPGQLPSPHSIQVVLTRPALMASWDPEPLVRRDPMPSSGLFQYSARSLAMPSQAPRPDLDPSLTVMAAPRPGDPISGFPGANGHSPEQLAEFAGEGYAEPEYTEQEYAEPEYTEQAYTEQEYAEPEYTEQVDAAPAEPEEENLSIELEEEPEYPDHTDQVEIPDDDL